MKSIFSLLAITFFILFSDDINAQNLGRRAYWQAQIKGPSAQSIGAIILSIEEGSPLHKAGLKKGDLILKVNDSLIDTYEVWSEITYSLRANTTVKINYKRGVNYNTINIELKVLAKEKHSNIETYYESVTSNYGITQRVIITKPNSPRKRQPAIILLQGLSCSTIEKHPGRSSNWMRVITDLVEKSGMVVLRVDKPGVGDSEGDCGETDFITELSGYNAAVELLKTKSYVDTTKIVVYGSSIGSALAPYIANKYNLSGIISDGTFFKTWFEHMLEIERRILQMEGKSEEEITNRINNISIPLYYGMLIEKKSFAQVIMNNPYLKGNNRHSNWHMYGRPVSYYQQLQDFNFAKEWENITVPVRIMRGTNDWIMSDIDNNMIVKTLKKSGHKDFELYLFEGLDHWNTIHDSPDNSFNGKPGEWDDQISEIIIKWAREMVIE